MKNLLVLTQPEEILTHITNLWQTEDFLDSLYVENWMEKFAQFPCVFYDMTQPKIESSHFSTWWRFIAHRPNYTNPTQSDLYYLHEIIHAATMTYNSKLDYEPWRQKMIDNEFNTSLETECMVYYHIPELRERSFPHEIWVDRFLDKDFNGADIRRMLGNERRRVMANPNPDDFIEMQIANYKTQNYEWANIWNADLSRLTVEEIMEEFTAYHNIHGKYFAIKYLINEIFWNEIPFEYEAKAFAEIYNKNKKLYGNEKVNTIR